MMKTIFTLMISDFTCSNSRALAYGSGRQKSKSQAAKLVCSILIVLTIGPFALAGQVRDRAWALAFLGLTKDATSVEIKSAFRSLAKDLHPDAGGNHNAFVELNDAFKLANNKTSSAQVEMRHETEDFFKYAVPAHRTFMLAFRDHPKRDLAYETMREWDLLIGNDLYRLFALTTLKSKKDLANQSIKSQSILEEVYLAHRAFVGEDLVTSLPANTGDESDTSLRKSVSDGLLEHEFYSFFTKNPTAMTSFFVEYLKVALPNHDFSIARKILESGWAVKNPSIYSYFEHSNIDSQTHEFIHAIEIWRLKLDPYVFENLEHFVRMARQELLTWDELFAALMSNGSRRPSVKNLNLMSEILSHVPDTPKRKAAFWYLMLDVPVTSEIPEFREMIRNATSKDISLVFPMGDAFTRIKRNRPLLYQALLNIERLEPGLLLKSIETLKAEIRSGKSDYGDGPSATRILKSFSQDSSKLLRELSLTGSVDKASDALPRRGEPASIRSCKALFHPN